MPRLDPFGRSVPVGSALLRTPGLDGEVEVSKPADAEGFRGSDDFSERLRDVLAAEEVQPLETYRFSGTREIDIGAEPTRGPSGEPAIVLERPAPAADWRTFVLASDESGVLTWHLSEPSTTAGPESDTTRGDDSRQVFVLRRPVPRPTPTEAAENRGLIAAVGRKVLQVLAFRAVEAAGGLLGEWAARRWETAKRPYRVRGFTPDSYALETAPAVDDRGWEVLGAGPSLLLLHGTFSRAHSGFGTFPRDIVDWMHRAYAGRVFAFDHFTLSDDPEGNVDELITRLPSQTNLEVDIVCHSRGGLVARSLAARQGALSVGDRTVSVRKVVFVASPNGGTVLADGRHLGAFVDRYTNLLSLLPDATAVDVLGVVIDVVKHLSVGAMDALPGLTSMRPGSAVITGLPAVLGGITSGFGLAADYEPGSVGRSGLGAYVRDGLMDRIFQSAANDLVVPTDSVWSLGGGRRLELAARHSFAVADDVDHSRFFGNRVALEQLKGWLSEA